MVPYTQPKDAALPVIDLGCGRNGAEIGQEIRKAALDTGFFYVSNHGVARSVLDAAFAALPAFYGLPLEAKERLRRGKGRRGYEGIGVQVVDSGSAPDLKESWNVSTERDPSDPDYAVNQWPAGLPGFREAIETYYAAVEGVAERLTPLFARSLDLAPDYFATAFNPAQAGLRTLCYPPQPETATSNQMGAGAHTDFGAITILAQDDCGGLELRNVAGEWLRAKVIPDTFVVNIGDMLSRWTNDRYRSSVHRVMNAVAGRTRYSMAFFYSPSGTTKIETIPSCLKPGEAPKYEPILAGDYVQMRFALSRQHLEDAALRG